MLLAPLARLARACAHVATASRSWFTLAFGLVSLSPHRSTHVDGAYPTRLGIQPWFQSGSYCCAQVLRVSLTCCTGS